MRAWRASRAARRKERVVQADEVQGGLGLDTHGFLEFQFEAAGAALFGPLPAAVVDQDAADHLGGDAEEVGPVLPADLALVDEAEEGFMDDGGALQGVVGSFGAQASTGEAAEFIVDQGHQVFEGMLVAVAPVDEERRDGGVGAVGGWKHLLLALRGGAP
jgi:hypothetical protein